MYELTDAGEKPNTSELDAILWPPTVLSGTVLSSTRERGLPRNSTRKITAMVRFKNDFIFETVNNIYLIHGLGLQKTIPLSHWNDL